MNILGTIGHTASEDVVIQLTKSKCEPCLMYGLDASYLTKSQLNSLDFVISRLFVNFFKTNNIDIVKYCQYCISFEVSSELWVKRVFDSLTRKSRNVLIRSLLDFYLIANANSANNIIS